MIERTVVAGGVMVTVFEGSLDEIEDREFYKKIKRTTEIAKSYFFGCKKNRFLKIECGLDVTIKGPVVYRYKKRDYGLSTDKGLTDVILR